MTQQHVVFLTGAGISVDSGLSTFRGKNGLWTNEEWAYLASTDALYNDTQKCLDFYNWRRKQLAEVEPNDAHRMIAELETMAKQLYDYWFVQFDFPNENGKPYKSSGGKMVYNEKLKREIPEGWDVQLIGSILDKVQSTSRLVTDEYLDDGLYPIIDQTTDVYFAGIINREDAILQQYPAIVFGDHSCAVKYVNFPFARGADGTQIMLSKNENVSIEYMYFYVKDINIGKGYARHYSFVKDYPIIIPSSNPARLFKKMAEVLVIKIKQLI